MKEEDAYVLDVETGEGTEPSFTVIVPRYGIEGRVRLPHIIEGKDMVVRDAVNHSITLKDNGCTIQVFQKVRVKIWVKIIQETQKELMLELVDPIFGGPSDNSTPTNNVTVSSEGAGSGTKRLVSERKTPTKDVKNNKKRRRKKN